MAFRIDPHTISLYNGIYARILVEVDLSRPLPERILVMKKNQNSINDFEFIVDIEFENLPKFCEFCAMLGHVTTACRKKDFNDKNQRSQTEMVDGNCAGLTAAKRNIYKQQQHHNVQQHQNVTWQVQQNGRRCQYTVPNMVERQEAESSGEAIPRKQSEGSEASLRAQSLAEVAMELQTENGTEKNVQQPAEVDVAARRRPWQLHKARHREEMIDKMAQ